MGYPRWKNSKGYICTGTMATCMKELKSQVTKSLPHTSTKCVQAFTTEKESVKEDPNKIVIQLDFAENYSIPLKFKMKSSQLIGHTVKSLSSQSAHGTRWHSFYGYCFRLPLSRQICCLIHSSSFLIHSPHTLEA